jgi:hypothetical protein
MVTSQQLYNRFGVPEKEKNMSIFQVPKFLALEHIPSRIYCNNDIQPALLYALKCVSDSNLQEYIRTWDGCFNIRRKKASSSTSLHAWGYAIDINAAWNGYNKQPTMLGSLVHCFESAGFEWGGHWKTPDGMHFQLAEVPK